MNNLQLLANSMPFLLLAAVWIGAVLALRFGSARNAHRERMAALSRGTDIRPLLINATPAFGHRIFLLRGLLWLFGGVALLVTLTVMLNGIPGLGGPPGLVGIIPMSVGLAYLVFYWIEERRVSREPDQSSSGTATSRPDSSSDA